MARLRPRIDHDYEAKEAMVKVMNRDRHGMWRALPALGAGVCVLAGCSFDPSGVPGDPDAGMTGTPDAGEQPPMGGPDARMDAAVNMPPDAALPDAYVPPDANDFPAIEEDVAHVPVSGEYAGRADLSFAADATIDTDTLTIDPAPDVPVMDWAFDVKEHDPAAAGVPELAVLHVSSLSITEGVTVRVKGSLPLVVIAGADIDIGGILDAAAHGEEPGASGGAGSQGASAGSAGMHKITGGSSGGGGGGFGDSGGAGGNGNGGVAGGAGGMPYGDAMLTHLLGGSGGGDGGSGTDAMDCPPGRGGAGGGAVQLYAGGTITVGTTGKILAGGGGGGGATGRAAGCSGALGGGGGGGSGGAIHLQAPTIALQSGKNARAVLLANGGGGGSGASGGTSGNPGGDGSSLDTSTSPQGGESVGNGSGAGGAGGYEGATSGVEGGNAANGGGGGGGVGRIVISTHEGGLMTNVSIISPDHVQTTYGLAPAQ